MRNRHRKKAPHRKRGRLESVDKLIFSGSLRQVSHLLSIGEFGSALLMINQLIADNTYLDDSQTRKLSCLAAEAQIHSGESSNALAVLEGIRVESPPHGVAWFRPALVVFRYHLATDLGEARNYAEGILSEATNRSVAFDEFQPAGIGVGVPVDVPPRPLRPSDVAERLAGHFFSEGEFTHASFFYETAISSVARGAAARSKAYLGLARIALATGAAGDAFIYAERAMANGRYSQKTLGCWAVMAKACLSGGPEFTPNLLSVLAQATPALRAKAYQTIAQASHRYGHHEMFEATRVWADANYVAFPIEATEIGKIAQARERKSGLPTVAVTAGQIAAAPRLSPAEFVSAARHKIAATPIALQSAVLDGLGNQVSTFSSATARVRMTHGLALIAASTGNVSKAQMLMTSAYGLAAIGSKGRRRAAWALAALAEAANDRLTAATLFEEIGLSNSAPARFRNVAAIRWLKNVAASENEFVLSPLFRYLENYAQTASDGPALLALARQLQPLRSAVTNLRNHCLARGLELSYQALEAAPSMAGKRWVALQIIRSHRLQQQFEDIFPLWNSYFSGASDKECDAIYWEAATSVFWAHVGKSQHEAAEAYASEALTAGDPGPEGWGWLGNARGTWRLAFRGQTELAMSDFQSTRTLAPKHAHTAKGVYWLMIYSYSVGNQVAVAELSNELELLLPKTSGYLWQESIRRKANFLRNSLIAGNGSSPEVQALVSADAEIADDLATVGASS